MSFYLFFFCGILGGVLGGMGMGGGTLLIPLLCICGVEQGVAQAANLFSFLPASLVALRAHAKGGLLQTDGLWQLILPALACSVLFSLLAVHLPSLALRKGFGAFLCGLAMFRFFTQNRQLGVNGRNFYPNGKNIFKKGMDKPRFVC